MRINLINRLAGAATAALLGAAIAATPLIASAQQSSPAPAAPMASPAPAAAPAAKHARHTKRSHTDRVEAQITRLHTQLKITPDEETQWGAVAQAMRDNAHQMDSLGQTRAKDRASMSAVDNLKSYEAMVDAHADGLKRLVPAMQALYDAMPDAQKKVADAVFGQRPQHRMHRAG